MILVFTIKGCYAWYPIQTPCSWERNVTSLNHCCSSWTDAYNNSATERDAVLGWSVEASQVKSPASQTKDIACDESQRFFASSFLRYEEYSYSERIAVVRNDVEKNHYSVPSKVSFERIPVYLVLPSIQLQPRRGNANLLCSIQYQNALGSPGKKSFSQRGATCSTSQATPLCVYTQPLLSKYFDKNSYLETPAVPQHLGECNFVRERAASDYISLEDPAVAAAPACFTDAHFQRNSVCLASISQHDVCTPGDRASLRFSVDLAIPRSGSLPDRCGSPESFSELSSPLVMESEYASIGLNSWTCCTTHRTDDETILRCIEPIDMFCRRCYAQHITSCVREASSVCPSPKELLFCNNAANHNSPAIKLSTCCKEREKCATGSPASDALKIKWMPLSCSNNDRFLSYDLTTAAAFNDAIGRTLLLQPPIGSEKTFSFSEQVAARALAMLKACGYSSEDIVQCVALSLCQLNKVCSKLGDIDAREAAYLGMLQLFLSHCYLMDEACPIRAWHRYVFDEYCSFSRLNDAVMKLFMLQNFQLSADAWQVQQMSWRLRWNFSPQRFASNAAKNVS